METYKEVFERQQLFKAKLCVATYGKGLTYDEAIELMNDNIDLLKYTPIDDPSFANLLKWANDYAKVAEAINLVEALGEVLHLKEVKAIWSCDKGKITKAGTALVLKSTRAHSLEKEAREAVRAMLILEGASLRQLEDLEVVLDN